ncbi:hypothetical protein EI613_00075 [Azospirillum sp. 412522]|nr:hypothetical protein [Azospirillum sp. 412522]
MHDVHPEPPVRRPRHPGARRPRPRRDRFFRSLRQHRSAGPARRLPHSPWRRQAQAGIAGRRPVLGRVRARILSGAF